MILSFTRVTWTGKAECSAGLKVRSTRKIVLGLRANFCAWIPEKGSWSCFHRVHTLQSVPMKFQTVLLKTSRKTGTRAYFEEHDQKHELTKDLSLLYIKHVKYFLPGYGHLLQGSKWFLRTGTASRGCRNLRQCTCNRRCAACYNEC